MGKSDKWVGGLISLGKSPAQTAWGLADRSRTDDEADQKTRRTECAHTPQHRTMEVRMLHSTKTLRRLAHKRDDQGFTLIELMVVVLIIGILVGIAVLAFGTAQTSARNSRAQANLRSVQSAAAVAVANTASLTLPAITATDINNQEAGLVSASVVNTGQAYSTRAGLVCAQGDTNVYAVQFTASGTVRVFGPAASACPAAGNATGTAW